MNHIVHYQQRPNIAWPHIFMAIYGLGWSVTFDLGVRVYAAEIFTLVGLFIFKWRSVIQNHPMLRKVLASYALWVAAIAISDVVNGTALTDSLRNLGTPILGAASLIVVTTAFSKKISALLTYLGASTAAKLLMGEASYGNAFEDIDISIASIRENTNAFKVVVEPFLTPAILLAAYFLALRSKKKAAMLFGATALAFLALDSRGSGLVYSISALLLIVSKHGKKISTCKIWLTSFVVACVSYGIYFGYASYTIAFNPNGHNGLQLDRIENPYNPFQLLSQGRSEWLVLPTAVREKPIFGWGSWADDHDLRFQILRAELSNHPDLTRILSSDEFYYIPVHSLIGSAWIWSGLLGLFAMLWLIKIVWTMSRAMLTLKSPYLPILIFLVIGLLWGYFFSPAMILRLKYPIVLAALIVLTNNHFRPVQTTPNHNQANQNRIISRQSQTSPSIARRLQ